MTTRKLCDKCARDTAVSGRCPRLNRIDKPGTICDRCLSDGRLLILYTICCEPESRFGHTTECKREKKVATSSDLRRFATALFCTDPRVLTLVGNAYGDGLWDRHADNPELSTCLVLNRNTRVERLGRAWDLAADGHEPEATYRKEAEDRAFQMRKWDRELTEYGIETKRLTRERNAKEALKAGQAANASLAPPMPRAEHDANVAKFKAEEAEQNRLYSLKELQKREEEDTRKRQERAERRSQYVVSRAKVVTQDPPPAGDLIVRATADYTGVVVGGIEKDAIVDRVSHPNETVYHAYVTSRGGSRHPKVSGFVARKYLVDIAEEGVPVLHESPQTQYGTVKRGGRLTENGGFIDMSISERERQRLTRVLGSEFYEPSYPLTDAELAEVARRTRATR